MNKVYHKDFVEHNTFGKYDDLGAALENDEEAEGLADKWQQKMGDYEFGFDQQRRNNTLGKYGIQDGNQLDQEKRSGSAGAGKLSPQKDSSAPFITHNATLAAMLQTNCSDVLGANRETQNGTDLNVTSCEIAK